MSHLSYAAIGFNGWIRELLCNRLITNFEDKIIKFRKGFAKNYESASNHFEKAIDEIDKAIARMQKVKQELTTSENQLRLANQKAEGLTIKKLTYGNPTMKEKFNKLKDADK